ncbi:NAD(P)-binding protein, partial [Atractiella rhizophila]
KSRTTVFITGCSEGGLGWGMSRAFAQKGCTVFATARDVSKMRGLSELGCILLPLDVTDQSSVQAAVEACLSDERSEGKIDILINNAGVACCLMPLIDAPVETYQQVFDVNLFGVVRLTNLVAPHMISRRSGKILNINSIAGAAPGAFWQGVYSSSKSALQAYSAHLAAELSPFDVQVSNVFVGSTVTPGVPKELETASLPSSSVYSSIWPQIQRAIQSPSSTSLEEFSDRVVAVMLAKKTPARWWTSKFSTICWFLTWFNPITIALLTGGQFGLKDLAPRMT